ncbi:unnamed protein product [Ectocarpus fasciculatus]
MSHLAKCPHMKRIIEVHDIPNRLFPDDQSSTMKPYNILLKTIVYQQVAGAAASSILNKFISALGVASIDELTPEIVHAADFAVVFVDGKKKIHVNGTAAGLSESKMKYILSLTDHFLDPTKLKDFNFETAGDADIVERLTAVKGLGLWSVHIFMITQLHRPDVLATGDLAVRRSICMVYGLPAKALESGKKGEFEAAKVCAHWSPFATLGCLYMWKIANTVTT